LKEALKPGDCLIVEDAPAVIRSVKAEGFPTLAVATSYAPSSLGDADWVCESLRPEEVKRKIPELKLGV
jgi:beta-phosphoglucomutase-like phosphatase (HAD superfamily)